MPSEKTVIVHSGGMDSSICLALARSLLGEGNVFSLSFSYGQRHSNEILQAQKICSEWKVPHRIIPLDILSQLTSNALIDKSIAIEHREDESPNTLVTGRNGLMAWLAALYALQLGANSIYLGVMGLEGANSGYRDCSREYMDLVQSLLRIDLGNSGFEIRTPLVHMLKRDTMHLAYRLGVLEYLLKETITCYEGIPHRGCGNCPSCLLRNEGIQQFIEDVPDFSLPFS